MIMTIVSYTSSLTLVCVSDAKSLVKSLLRLVYMYYYSILFVCGVDLWRHRIQFGLGSLRCQD